jgi:Ran GTPase-activating protein (RanGAP) involved in mRNA processing and transport
VQLPKQHGVCDYLVATKAMNTAVAKFDKIPSDESFVNSDEILQYLANNIAQIEKIHCSHVFQNEDVAKLHTILFENHEIVKLRSLKLPKNGLTTESVPSLARIIQQTELLREIDLSDNEIKPEGLSFLLDHALLLPTCLLESIHLSNNKLGPKGASVIASLLRAEHSLRELSLSHNSFGRSIKSMGLYLGRLVRLDLSQNKLGDRGAHIIGEVLAAPECLLEVLDLSNNKIGYSGAYHLADAFIKGHNKSLQILNLMDNNIETEGAEAFGVVLKFSHTLRELNLSRNSIGDNGVRLIAQGIIENEDTCLQSLDVSWNGIKDAGAGFLAEMLMQNSALTHLNLKCNFICDSGMKVLAESLKADMALEVLNLVGNQMRDPSPFIHVVCCHPIKLKTLYFEQNVLTDEAENQLHAAFAFRENKKGWLGKILRDIKEKKMICFDLTKKRHGDEELLAIMVSLAKFKPCVTSASFGGSMVSCRSVGRLSECVVAANEVNLQRLYIKDTPLGFNGAVALAKALLKNTTIRCLSLKRCDLGEGSLQIARALADNASLLRLDLEGNSIGDLGFQEICKSVFTDSKNHPSLISLNVANNRINDAGLSHLHCITKLEDLRLDGNRITDMAALDIAKAVMGHSSLKWLCLRNTDITWKGVRALTLFLHTPLVLDADCGLDDSTKH